MRPGDFRRGLGNGTLEFTLTASAHAAPKYVFFRWFSLGFAPIIAVVAVFETRLREAPGAPQGVPKSSGRLQMNSGASPGAAFPRIE